MIATVTLAALGCFGPPNHAAAVGAKPEGRQPVVVPDRVADRKLARRRRARDRNHAGLVMAVDGGANHCRGPFCSRTHSVRPSAAFGGFIGGNYNGWFELGVAGGYGRFDAEVPSGASVLGVFGMDTDDVRAQAEDAGIDPTLLDITSVKLWTANVGPTLRIHLVPRGSVTAYVGTGAHYRLFRSDYGTLVGDVALGFHGIGIPAEGGLGVYLSDKVVLLGSFQYTFAYYGAVNLDHPAAQLVAPIGLVDTLLDGQSLKGSLPDFWAANVGLRFVFDRQDPR